MQKKRNIFIITIITLSVLLLLAAVGAAVFFWRLPHFWQDKLQNGFLLNHRNILRAKSVEPGAFNKFILHDLQLGDSSKPLFTAPRAELILQPDWENKFSTLPIESLILYGCQTRIETSSKKVFVNGILLEKLVKELARIPDTAPGKQLTLIIHSQLAFGNKKPSADLTVKIRKDQGKLNIQGSWAALADKKICGSWLSFIDLGNDTFSATLSDCITGVFMQEMLLRSGADPKFTALLHKGNFSGSGNFSGKFSTLAIKELAYSGKVEKPVIAFYRHKIRNADTFELKIEKNAQGLSCRIPQFGFDNKALLKNISINCRKKVTFSSDCDFQQLAAVGFLPCDIKSDIALNGKIRGSWDTASNVWQFSKNSAQTAAQPLRAAIDDSTISMQLEKFDFKLQGKAAAGTLTQELKFKNLEVYDKDNKKQIQIANGSANTKTIFGSDQRPDQYTLGIRGSEFTANSGWGVIELPGFSASAEMQLQSDNMFDAFVSFSGAQARASNPHGLISAIGWRGFFRLAFDRKTKNFDVKTFDFKSDDLKLDISKKEYSIPQIHLQFSGAFKSGTLQSLLLNAAAAQITADQLDVEQPTLKANYNTQRPQNEKIKISARSSKVILPPTEKLMISRALNAAVDLSVADGQGVPHKIDLQADVLDWSKGEFSGTFQNSKWKIQQKPPRLLNCTAEFDYLRLKSKNNKFGSSQIGKSSLSADLDLNTYGREQVKLLGIMEHVSSQKGDYHIGSESVQCEFNFNKKAAAPWQGNIIMNQANILGPHLTVSTPVLQAEFSAVSAENISGNIDIAPGTITNQSGDLELRQAQFNLPLQISTKVPAMQSAGKLTAADIFYKQKREGSFSGTIRHFMQLPASVTDTLAHQIELEGQFLADKFNKSPVKLQSTWLLPPEKSSIKWQFSMQESKLVQPLILSEYLSLPVNSAALKGNFTLEGNASFNAGELTESVIKLNSINSDWQLGALTAQGLTAAGVLTLADKSYALMPHDVSIGKLLWDKWELLNNEMNVSLSNTGKLQIANWQASLLGGRMIATRFPAVDLNKPADTVSVKMALEDMPLTEFFNRFDIKSFVSDARLGGDIQLGISNQGIKVENSELAFKAPAGKKLQLKLANPADLKMRDIAFRDFTIAVLSAMKCYQANFNFSTAEDEVLMKVKAEGVPAEPVPFVYQGRSGGTPFRPARAGENGFAGEIELNVNLKLRPDNKGN